MGAILRRWFWRNWLLLLCLLMTVYFGYHALHGQRGLLAWVDVSRELQQARSELAAAEAENERLQQLVDGLQPDRLDPDLLEEELRRLGYVDPGEVVILTPEDDTAEGPAKLP
jgi:cell division protein FtsB